MLQTNKLVQSSEYRKGNQFLPDNMKPPDWAGNTL
jgi:hypothetical protein